MALGAVSAVNVATGAREQPKYIQAGLMSEVYTAALGVGLANTDTILGPILPAGCYLQDVVVDVDDLDSATSLLFTVGISGTPAKFISSSSVGQTGGIARANVAGTVGYSPATDTQIIVTITATGGTPVAGTMRISAVYTASP